MTDQKVRIGFRVLNLLKDDAEKLRHHAKGASVRPQKDRKDTWVLSFWLEATETYDWLDVLVRDNGLSEQNYGFFVSIVTERDTEIVALPEFASAIFRRIGGRLEFSFTCIGKADGQAGGSDAAE